MNFPLYPNLELYKILICFFLLAICSPHLNYCQLKFNRVFVKYLFRISDNQLILTASDLTYVKWDSYCYSKTLKALKLNGRKLFILELLKLLIWIFHCIQIWNYRRIIQGANHPAACFPLVKFLSKNSSLMIFSNCYWYP